MLFDGVLTCIFDDVFAVCSMVFDIFHVAYWLLVWHVDECWECFYVFWWCENMFRLWFVWWLLMRFDIFLRVWWCGYVLLMTVKCSCLMIVDCILCFGIAWLLFDFDNCWCVCLMIVGAFPVFFYRTTPQMYQTTIEQHRTTHRNDTKNASTYIQTKT